MFPFICEVLLGMNFNVHKILLYKFRICMFLRLEHAKPLLTTKTPFRTKQKKIVKSVFWTQKAHFVLADRGTLFVFLPEIAYV